MEIIFRYDIERLEAYSKNIAHENNIKVIDSDDVKILQFPEVGYFNYSFSVLDEPFTEEKIELVINSYKEAEIECHKIIAPSDCEKTKTLLCEQFGYKHVKTIVKTSYPHDEPPVHPLHLKHEEIELANVDETNIHDFTHTYLNGFESTNNDYERITGNFKQLLDIDNIKLYLLKNNEQHVGINVLYKFDDEYLLAGGAILKEYRNRNYHKHGIVERIKHSILDDNSIGIYSSAYDDSISVNNMLSVNMIVSKKYNVYEHSK